MAYPSFSSRREQRRRRLLVALIVVTLVAVVGFAARHRSDRRATSEYLVLAADVAAAEEIAADELETVLTGVGTMGRQELVRTLDMLEASTAEAALLLDDAEVPAPIAPAHGYLAVAATAWRDAAGDFAGIVRGIVDGPVDGDDVDALRRALAGFQVGDVAYGGFLGEVAALDAALVPRALPEVAFVGRRPIDVQLLVLQLAAAYGLGEHPDVSITGTVDPPPAGSDGTTAVLPFAEDIDVQVVVVNTGNDALGPLTVTLRLVAADGSDPVTETANVARIEAQQAATVDFPDLLVRPGVLYELVADAELDGDVSPGDNAWRMIFLMNRDA